MNKKQIWYLFGAMICIFALIAIMAETCILAKEFEEHAVSVLIASAAMCFASYSGFMYFYDKFFIEHEKINNI